MEREIKFRGKNLKNGKWVYGNIQIPIYPFDEYYMWDEDKNQVQVDKDTISQFIGQKDVLEKDIYEGDIMRSQYGRMYYIKYDENSCSFLAVQFGDDIAYPYILLKDWIHLFGKMVIGNIYDNKDLLKEGEVKNA